MTVQQLINLLSQVEDKSYPVTVCNRYSKPHMTSKIEGISVDFCGDFGRVTVDLESIF